VPSTVVTLMPVVETDFAELRELAEMIWRQHYADLLSAAQIDYMLACRFSDEALRHHVRSAATWLELLRVSGKPVGYCGYELMPHESSDLRAAVKLGQLYVLQSSRGVGLGRFMLHRIERRARELGRQAICLQVNKRNVSAIAFYRSMGFAIVREAVVDIGSGFVMDDYVMEKSDLA